MRAEISGIKNRKMERKKKKSIKPKPTSLRKINKIDKF